MDRFALHKIWTPDDGPWSPWVKPVPFAFWPRAVNSPSVSLRSYVTPALFPSVGDRCALVIDLPGAESVHCGILLAKLGYQPVPVFASCPADNEDHGLHLCAVDAASVINALAETAPVLAECQPSASSPPAFLIDATRRASHFSTQTSYFDNRSAIFASDFPSAQTLGSRGIARALIVRDHEIAATPDLAFALDHWRNHGLQIDAITINGSATPITWPARSGLGKLLHHLKLFFTLRANRAGGYGRFVPESSGG